MRARLLLLAISMALFAEAAVTQPPGYVAPEVCASCHGAIAATYAKTGMGRSFMRASPAGSILDFYNKVSDTHYSMLVRDGRYTQRRWQLDASGRQINLEERAASYVLGSGNHARTWLASSPSGKLIELPLGWYSEKGGYWAMNPGYDAVHPPSQRPITYECMFCHNAYPRLTSEHKGAVYRSELPEGIDCQRCHGPGARHVQNARTTVPNAQNVRDSIVNPARLPKDRQMEVCMQCHLETTSTRLPSLVRRFGRPPFSYLPGEPLGNFVLSFDHAPNTGHDDKFEIAGAAYRLRQSQCFLKSEGRMTCTTCHNPHDIPRGIDAEAQYSKTCRQCHSFQDAAHVSADTCTGCHMPKRRTEDAVHVVMTDHRIARIASTEGLLTELAESHPSHAKDYQGEVIPFYPALGTRSDDALYIALAQLQHDSNLAAGFERLNQLLAKNPNAAPEFHLALEDARQRLGMKVKPRSAAQPDPETPDYFHLKGLQQGADGESSFRRALEIDPYFAPSHASLARLLAARGNREGALYYFGKAALLAPSDAVNHYEYALTLLQLNRFEDSQVQVQAAVNTGPDLAEAHELLGGLLSRKQQFDGAFHQFEEAVRLKPKFARAQLDLGATLASRGDYARAEEHLRLAAKSEDKSVADLAQQVLRQLRR